MPSSRGFSLRASAPSREQRSIPTPVPSNNGNEDDQDDFEPQDLHESATMTGQSSGNGKLGQHEREGHASQPAADTSDHRHGQGGKEAFDDEDDFEPDEEDDFRTDSEDDLKPDGRDDFKPPPPPGRRR
ncbi:unnamed protein product [Zymoseptoria tritici ST99CH_1A5]|uniref:Uncharacterized protein n=2 Tax=Zymoseptoria tritici TaxID=1047171 RepID=A0A2H1H8Z8_ZYMTR|nr:unnamed protein product [Zymoseptoria tritici ST99CH_1E4]SMY30145.1 unnamed protein product [Zymoseptoria tritici ST99CH_1A5]